ncbi:Rv1355c family protein [Pedobacter xixiisoli]|uniref:ThiF family protein n=1 Tax=Pedobacter xixiisoli TaxID=1476464 RepID=A0A285ZXR9_9SPHI|nr:Rv1355c family protein [Pedobacter xixiisoli]SOD14449.1 ThiF family protein [Pedobacter xixiisoli]
MYKLDVTSPLHVLLEQTKKNQDLYKPLILRLVNDEDRVKFAQIVTETPGIQIFDTIKEQVTELLRCLKPLIVFMPKNELENIITQKLGNSDEYGVWVYYPWSNKLVHLLDEAEFLIVRTNRNKYKITDEEQQTLATKKIGIMGLSVGQSVALTLAMERGFGELRIADFDELDLSNINRIRTGVQNIKLKKTVIVAREIAEIDPFLNVVCYHEGITEENLNDFLTGNGKLDLLIDECDSFDIKINARTIAKALQIPVLMEGSDRGTIDIERFDLEPERPILHGLVAHLDMDKFKDLKSFDEKVPYITAVTGFETLSPRMKASAVELMATISTWPQLASAVTFGGGVSADLSRKILLNNLKVSGRFFLDLDEMITDEPVIKSEKIETVDKEPLSTQEIEDFIKTNHLSEADNEAKDLSESELLYLIEAAKKAPSGGNNQPWRWHYRNKKLHLFLDESTALAYLDPEFISSYASIGSAIENLLLASAVQQLEVKWQLTPQFAPKHIAVFSFSAGQAPTNAEILLEQQIPLRHTNRKSPQRAEISDEDVSYLTDLITQTPGAELTFVKEPAKIKSLAEIATQTDLLRMFIPEAHEDFLVKEMRWTAEQANLAQDGIGIHTLDLSNNDQMGMTLLRDRKMIDFLEKINGGSAFNRLLVQQFMSSSAIGLITMPNSEVTSWINSGIAAERMWLGATSLGYQIHPVNVPLIFFYKNAIENSLTISNHKKEKLTQTEKELNLIFDKSENQTSMFMFRIFKASASPQRTIRKSNDKIFSIGRA